MTTKNDKEEMTFSKLLDLIAKQDERINMLEARIAKLEPISGASGVYLEGAPDYIKDYAFADKQEKTEEVSLWKK